MARLQQKREALEAKAGEIAETWRNGNLNDAIIETLDRSRGPKRVLLAVLVHRELGADAADDFTEKLASWILAD
jgi:hypothetical protein